MKNTINNSESGNSGQNPGQNKSPISSPDSSQDDAVKKLAALAHHGRLGLIRWLIQAGSEGLAAGDLVRLTGSNNSTVSAQLLVLANAGLVQSQRQGRFIIYSARYSAMRELLAYLVDDCCCGSTDICGPLLGNLA